MVEILAMEINRNFDSVLQPEFYPLVLFGGVVCGRGGGGLFYFVFGSLFYFLFPAFISKDI